MTLRRRVLRLIGLAFIVLLGALYVVQRWVLLRSFATLERQHMEQDVERARRTIQQEIQYLDLTTRDWAAWDDTYRFVQDGNEAYRQANLFDEALINIRVNLLLIADTSGHVVFEKGLDLTTQEEIPIPEFAPEALAVLPGHLLLDHPDTESTKTGIVLLSQGPMLLASRPIITSDGQGPIRGTFIMGRFLDQDLVGRVAETAQLSLLVRRVDDAALPAESHAALPDLSTSPATAVWVQPLTEQVVAGYALLDDLYGQPALILRVERPRDLYQEGKRNFYLLALVLTVGWLLLIAVITLVAQVVVLSPLQNLTQQVHQVGQTSDLSTRVSAPRQDEIGQLAGGINTMLGNLERAAESARQRERYLGGLAKAAQSLLAPALGIPYEPFLESLGHATRTSRTYVFLTHRGPGGELLASRRAEWCAPGIAPRLGNPELLGTPYPLFGEGFPMIAGGFGRWFEALSRGEPVSGVVSELPAAERAALELDDTKAILALPLIMEGSLAGFIGFDQCDVVRDWQPATIDLLRTAAADLTLALRRERHGLVQNAIYQISEAVHSTGNLQALFVTIHAIVAELMPAQNLYFATCEGCPGTLSFPYFVDERDAPPAPRPLGHGVTEYVLRTGQPLLADARGLQELAARGELDLIGSPPLSWLGVPLQVGAENVGVLVVQSYTEGVRYGETERDILTYVAHQVAMAIERKRAEDQRRHHAAELERANEEIKQFAYIVSHDLRAPLVNLKGFAAELHSAVEVVSPAVELALPRLDEEQRTHVASALHEDVPEALGFIDSSLNRLDRFISALLKLSRLGRSTLHPELLDVEALVRSTLGTLAYQVEARQVQVTVGPLPQVSADRTALQQVLGNLLDNALKYLDPGRPGEVEISAEPGAQETVFRIRDNGRGIARDDLPKVFMPFRRFGKQDVPGEGMGLPYVQALVRRLGGRIWCESETDVGTTFAFTIPNRPVQGDDHA
jgi:sensor domain CHASE-containing protein/signal transduction histidine kinase